MDISTLINCFFLNPVSSCYQGLPSIGDLWNNSYTFRNDSKDYENKKEQSFLIINFKSCFCGKKKGCSTLASSDSRYRKKTFKENFSKEFYASIDV